MKDKVIFEHPRRSDPEKIETEYSFARESRELISKLSPFCLFASIIFFGAAIYLYRWGQQLFLVSIVLLFAAIICKSPSISGGFVSSRFFITAYKTRLEIIWYDKSLSTREEWIINYDDIKLAKFDEEKYTLDIEFYQTSRSGMVAYDSGVRRTNKNTQTLTFRAALPKNKRIKRFFSKAAKRYFKIRLKTKKKRKDDYYGFL